jgi:hypothetical protein
LARIRSRYPGPYVLYTSLAEGADRLVAWRALDILEAGLSVVLPMEAARYRLDFEDAGSAAEFNVLLGRAGEVVQLPPMPDRPAAYEAAGRYILDRVDVLIAVWDGRPPRGRGGTGQMVTEARQRKIPLIWINSSR